MSKMTWAAGLAAIFMAQTAMAQYQSQQLPYVSNTSEARGQNRVESLASRVDTRLDGLSDSDTDALDQITSGAAARAVLALRCESAQFERVSKSVQQMMESKVDMVTRNTSSARAYAKDSALMKYKAMAMANAGVSCADLENLRHIAAAQGFEQ
jgi:hypothetical protein